jgi:O-antigen/teichoic acid export membrane protein
MSLTVLAGVLYSSTDRIILGRPMGPAVAGQYNIYVQLTQLVHFMPSSLFAFSLPAFTRLAARGREGAHQIARPYRKYLGVISLMALVTAAGLLASWPTSLNSAVASSNATSMTATASRVL